MKCGVLSSGVVLATIVPCHIWRYLMSSWLSSDITNCPLVPYLIGFHMMPLMTMYDSTIASSRSLSPPRFGRCSNPTARGR